MALERSDIEMIFDAKLQPLADTVARIERTMEQIVEIQKIQARQDERILQMRHDVDRCIEGHAAMIKEHGNKTWDVLKIFATAAVGAVFGAVAAKGWGK